MILLWDFDKTLAEREGAWSATLLEILHQHGYNHIALDEVRVYLLTGFPWHYPDIPHSEFLSGKTWWAKMEEYFEGVFKKLGADDAAAMSKQVREKYLSIGQWRLYPDTIETLETAIRRGHKNYILSNHVPELNFFVESLHIAPYFETVYTSADVGYEKPNPKFFEFVLTDAGISPSDAIMIGDNYIADILGAANMGIKGILVHSENTKGHDLHSKDLKGILNFL